MVEASKGTKNSDAAFRVARLGAIKWTSVPDDRSRTAAAMSKGMGWLGR